LAWCRVVEGYFYACAPPVVIDPQADGPNVSEAEVSPRPPIEANDLDTIHLEHVALSFGPTRLQEIHDHKSDERGHNRRTYSGDNRPFHFGVLRLAVIVSRSTAWHGRQLLFAIRRSSAAHCLHGRRIGLF